MAAPEPDACTWVKEIIPTEGDIILMSRSLKEQLVSHNMAVQEFCREG